MRKSVILGIVIFIIILLLSAVAVVLLNISDTDDKASSIVEKIYNMYPDDIDSATTYFMDSNQFKNMDKDKQINEMGNLLKLYQENNIIINLYYDESNQMFSFQYNFGNIKGALGGVSLKAWDPMMN